MNYALLKDVIELVSEFESDVSGSGASACGIEGFKKWMVEKFHGQQTLQDPDWEGKSNGRSAESAIATFIVHLNRYAKNYSKSAIHGSGFSTQEEFIYLINLKAFGAMSKMDLIKRNIHDKPVGMKIIDRLIAQGWVEQTDSKTDRRSKLISLTQKGVLALTRQMNKIRQATDIVSGNLNHAEKMQLIHFLKKLNDFHRPIYARNYDTSALLSEAVKIHKQ